MTVFYAAVIVQVLVFPLNMFLTWCISRKLLAMHRENNELKVMADQSHEDYLASEAWFQAWADLTALMLAIRLQAPRAYW